MPRTTAPASRADADQFPARLRKLLDELFISQADIAREFRTANSTVSQWLSGTNRPRRQSMLILAKFLGVNVGWLAFGEGDRTEAAQASALPATPPTGRTWPTVHGQVMDGFGDFHPASGPIAAVL